MNFFDDGFSEGNLGVIVGPGGTLGVGPGGMPDSFYSSGGTGLDWQNIINQGYALASQAFSAWGRNPSQQISGGGIIGIGQGYSPAAVLAAQPQQQQNQFANMTPAQQAAYQRSLGGGLGSGLGSGLDGAIAWGLANPVYPIGAAIILWLVFMKPPGSRR